MLLLVALFAAGCLSNSNDDSAGPPPLTSTDLAAHDSGGWRTVPAAFADLRFSVHATGYRRGEPSIAVAGDGSIFTVGEQSAVIRSRDRGVSWQVLDDGLTEPATDVDPFLWLDTDTGRLYNSRLTVDCVPHSPVPACAVGLSLAGWLSWSDTQGTSWAMNPLVGLALVDHQKLTTGPPPQGVATNGYPNLLYFVYNAIREGFVTDTIGIGEAPSLTDGVNVEVSNDGGATFLTHAQADANGCVGGIASPAVVAPDGTAYIAHYAAGCDGLWIVRSDDGGATWSRVGQLIDVGAAPWGLDPMMAVDDAGNAYPSGKPRVASCG